MTIDPNAGAEPVLARCEVSAARSGAGELGNGDKFLAAATDNAWTVSGEARTSLPKMGRPSDYTEWILLGRLDAMIQRVQ